MSSLSRFRKYTDSLGRERGDSEEGLIAWYQPDERTRVEIDGHVLRGSEMAAPMSLRLNWITEANALCFYAVGSGEWQSISEDEVNAFKETLKIHKDCFGLGKWAVVSTSTQMLVNRIREALDSLGYAHSSRPVHYFDEATHQGVFAEKYHGFIKRSIYSHQNEYRILARTGFDPPRPLILQVDDLSDVAMLIPASRFNDSIEITFHE